MARQGASAYLSARHGMARWLRCNCRCAALCAADVADVPAWHGASLQVTVGQVGRPRLLSPCASGRGVAPVGAGRDSRACSCWSWQAGWQRCSVCCVALESVGRGGAAGVDAARRQRGCCDGGGALPMPYGFLAARRRRGGGLARGVLGGDLNQRAAAAAHAASQRCETGGDGGACHGYMGVRMCTVCVCCAHTAEPPLVVPPPVTKNLPTGDGWVRVRERQCRVRAW